MNISHFIARKVAFANRRSFSALIIRIAVAAVALSLAVMIIATAVITGFKHQIGEKIFGFWGHIHITNAQVNRNAGEVMPISGDQPFLDDLLRTGRIPYTESWELAGLEWPFERTRHTKGGVRHVQRYALKPGIIKTRSEIEGIVLKGVGTDFDWRFFDKYLQEGERLPLSDSLTGSDVIISRQTADRLELKTGDRFIFSFVKDGELYPRRFTVRGIYKTGLEEYDRKFALVDIRKARELLGWEGDQVAGFEVFLDDLADLDLFTEYIYLELLTPSLYSESVREKFPAIFEWLALQDINEVVILALMVVVALINMVTALMILILERTNMIGILKALGMRNWDIRKVFLYHSAYIVGLGLFWGNLLGIGCCWLQERYGLIRLDEENYYLSVAPVELSWVHILLLNGGALLVILSFLTIPSWLVSRISPLKAIRFR
ncbi:MAG: hypothetical protein RLY31_2480 [Bacteroidota bacterium]